MAHKINIQDIGFIRHNVLQIQTDRPSGYDFTPGQACEMSIDQPKWKEEKRPFTFTSLPDDGFLQFTIKVYPDHDGVTDQLQTLEQGDSLLISDSWGAISYQGPGIFLAGGAGVTPFIAIIKDLARKGNLKGNKLIFGNQRERDIILQSDFERWLGKDFINILSDEHSSKFPHGTIDKEFIKSNTENLDKKFYLCGPPPMMDSVYNALLELDVPKKNIITEDFD
ncbi:flavodoxin reductase [Maribacter algicola]|uniref:Flavodoxin reductase n=1 Tax=Maribacter algicola TaxID=2498892 RepID=A0A3R8WE45_9FLAO|nr:flavodoxin reductase [Maribacter algicola]RRQ48353.1 flavodoxin reductase [Maribacter algicola]